MRTLNFNLNNWRKYVFIILQVSSSKSMLFRTYSQYFDYTVKYPNLHTFNLLLITHKANKVSLSVI